MFSRLRLFVSHYIAPFAVAIVLLHASSACAQSTFTSMAGAWSGNGTVQLRSGTQERVRCRANYDAPNAQNLKFELRCASDAYKFELSSSLVLNGEEISGVWFENTHRVGGRIYGQNNGGLIQARAEGDIVAALLTVRTTGARQSFLTESPGAQVVQVLIDLHR